MVTNYWRHHQESWKDYQKERCERVNKNTERIKERIWNRDKLLQKKPKIIERIKMIKKHIVDK